MTEIQYEVVQNIGVLSQSLTGWTKELNIIRWNDHDAKFDLREWSPGKERMSKGITLNLDEVEQLKSMLDGMVLDFDDWDHA